MFRTESTPRSAIARSFLIAAIVVGSVGLTQLTAPEPAVAGTTGAGIPGITPYGGYLGNYIMEDGSRAYCLDSGDDWPSGRSDGGNLVNGLTTSWGGALTATQITRLNYALHTWGQTADPVTAAAVNAYIYAYSSNYARTIGQGYAAGAHYIDGNRAVLAAYNVIWNQAESYTGPPASGGSGQLSITMTNGYDGTLTVSMNPTTAIASVVLTGGEFTSNGERTATVTNGVVLPIRGTPLDGEEKYSITATGTAYAPSSANQSLTVYTHPRGQQRTVRAGGVSEITFTLDAYATDPLATTFEPIVGTQVASRFVDQGAAFVDTLTADVAAGSEAWRQYGDGRYATIMARGTLYGPFTDLPDPSASAPVGAPIVGTESVALTGPGTYNSLGSLTATEAGYYTWVWSIDRSDQSPATQAQLPDGYFFSDQFGLVAETHIIPIALTAVSEVSEATIGLSGSVTDRLTVLLESGTWLTEGGVPVPAVFNGTAYFVAGELAPTPSTTVPADAVAIGTAIITAPGPGIYEASNPVVAPSNTAGYITWVWSLDGSSAYGAYFRDWSDVFGLPSETTRVDAPVVITQAVPAAPIGDPVHDTAIVSGTVPVDGAYLTFEAFLQVEGQPALCDASTRVYDSSINPVAVTTVGSYNSPSTTFTEYGTYYWIETLFSHADQVIHRGLCGEVSETTVISAATVTTQAVSDVTLGASAHDKAMVEGEVPTGAYLTFEAFKQEATGTDTCTTSTRVFSSSTPVMTSGPGEYESPETTFTETGTYYWVETLWDSQGAIIHRGECGARGETTGVTPARLAMTGATIDSAEILIAGSIAGGVVILGLLLLTAGWTRRRRAAARSEHPKI